MSRGLKRLDGEPRNAMCRTAGDCGDCGWRISTLPRFGVKWTDGLLAR
jgi:hypothetical protein